MTNATKTFTSKALDKNMKIVGAQNPAPIKPRRTKKSKLVALLKLPNGARTPTICKALNWQKHTVRAALSGLRKEGHEIITSKSTRDGVSVYRMVTKTNGTS